MSHNAAGFKEIQTRYFWSLFLNQAIKKKTNVVLSKATRNWKLSWCAVWVRAVVSLASQVIWPILTRIVIGSFWRTLSENRCTKTPLFHVWKINFGLKILSWRCGEINVLYQSTNKEASTVFCSLVKHLGSGRALEVGKNTQLLLETKNTYKHYKKTSFP